MLHVNDKVSKAESRDGFMCVVYEFKKIRDRMKMKNNVDKSKVHMIRKNQRTDIEKVKVRVCLCV